MDAKNCPFCNKEQPSISLRSTVLATYYKVECECGVSGPSSENRDNAIATWNNMPRNIIGITQPERAIAAAAIALYAFWKDGVEYVGTTGRSLKDAKRECLSGQYDDVLYVGKVGLDAQARRT